ATAAKPLAWLVFRFVILTSFRLGRSRGEQRCGLARRMTGWMHCACRWFRRGAGCPHARSPSRFGDGRERTGGEAASKAAGNRMERAMPKTKAARATEEDEAVLIARVLRRDPEALAILMRRYNRRLYRAAWGILRDEQEAEDAVQESYIKAFAGLAKFRGEAALATWLTRIVINEALMRRRRPNRLVLSGHDNVVPLRPTGASRTESNLTSEEQAVESPESAAIRGQL